MDSICKRPDPSAPVGLAPAERRIDSYLGVSTSVLRFPLPLPGPSGRAAAAENAKGGTRLHSSRQSLAPLGQARRGVYSWSF